MEPIVYETYMPEPHQQDIHDLIQTTRWSWIQGGFRSGKTRAAIEQDIENAVRWPGVPILITRKFNEDLAGSIKKDFYDIVDQRPGLIIKTEDGKDIATFANGSKVYFQGLYTRSSMQRSKLGGQQYGFIHGEESSELSLNDHLDLQGRLSYPGIPDYMRRGYYCTNPPNNDHWAFNEFEVNKRAGVRGIIKVSTKMNRKYLPATYIDDLEESYSRQPGWLSRFFEGNWGFTPKGDPVFPIWSDIFVDNSISYNKGRPVYRAWDFGWHHPCCVWLQIGPDLDVNILREKMGIKIYLRSFAPQVIAETNEHFEGAEIIDICDDAGKQQKDDGQPSITILEGDPFNLKMRYRQSYVAEGIMLIEAKMREMLNGKPAFRVKGQDCPIIVEAMRGGYARDGDDVIKDDYYDHPIDCIREAFINIFGSNVRELGLRFNAKDVKIASPSWGFNGKRISVGVS